MNFVFNIITYRRSHFENYKMCLPEFLMFERRSEVIKTDR